MPSRGMWGSPKYTVLPRWLYVTFLISFALASAVTVIVHRDLEVPWWTPIREAFKYVARTAFDNHRGGAPL